MASYHCSVKVGGKGKAGVHAMYISREGKYSGKARYEDLEATACGNMPPWAAHNSVHFWSAADEHERTNGATYREIEVALPRELDAAQRRALVEDFIKLEVGDQHAYQWAIHTPKAALEKGEQPHAHIMYSERTVDGIERDPEQYFKRYNGKVPERGGCRKDSAGTEERLQATRQRWADVQNRHLERHGQHERVDHRSLKDQGILRQAEKHIGASRVMDMAEQDVSALLARRAAEGALERAQQEVFSLIDLSGDLNAAMAQRERQRIELRRIGQEFARQNAAETAAKQAAALAAIAAVDPAYTFDPDKIVQIAALAKDEKRQERVRQSVVAELEKKLDAANLTAQQRALVMAEVRERLETTLSSLIQAAPKPGTAPAPAARPKANHLSVDDRALFQGAEQAIAAGDMKALSGQLHKIDQVERKLIEAVTLAGRDVTSFDEDGVSRQLSVRDAHRRREAINAAALARGEEHIPFAVGHSTLTADTYDYQQEQAVRALSLHARSSRPEGLFKKAAGREWDARKAELETTRAAWAGAVASRARAEQEATTTDNATFQYRLDAIRTEHAARAAAAIAKCAPIKERLQDFTAEHKRIERATGELSPQDQKELALERGRSHGRGR